MNRYLSKIILSAVLTILIAGCAGKSNVSQVVIDPTIPQVRNLKSLSGVSEVGLEWTPIYNERIKGYYIYRSDESKQMLERVATIKDRYASHYVDLELKPSTIYRYKMSAFATNGKESMASSAVSISTKKPPEPIPFVQGITDLPNRIKIIWRPHPYVGITSYVVQRKKPNDEKWHNRATVKGRLSAEYIDDGLSDNKSYKYRVLAKTAGGVLTMPSQVINGTTKPLPKMVRNVHASTNEPKKITISWSPNQTDEIAYYKVYSSPTSMLLYTYLAKTKKSKFEDLINSNGTTRYYKVTAVDVDDLESEKQDDGIMGQTLSALPAPTITQAAYNGFGVSLRWSPNPQAQSYMIIKESNGDSKIINDITSNSYVDSNILPNTEYTYEVIAIDKYGIKSDESDDVSVTTKGEIN